MHPYHISFTILFPYLPYFSSKTFLSMREGAWVVGRLSTGGLPVDINMTTRLNNLLLQVLPRGLMNWAVERLYNQKYNHRLYGLQPSYRCSGTKQHSTTTRMKGHKTLFCKSVHLQPGLNKGFILRN